MVSTYVRRLRLAAELKALRQRHGMSSERLARAIEVPRATISRLENARTKRPDPNDVMKILACLGATDEEWATVMTIAREASQRGWWDAYTSEMGPRQALYANLEAGAVTIREYHLTLLPGLLQTVEFARARAGIGEADWSAHFDQTRAAEARTSRQRMLHRQEGPRYQVVLDELAVRRPSAPAEVLHDQLLHLAEVADTAPRASVRVLPLHARIEGYTVPWSGFSIYTYPDPRDPVVVAVDTATDGLVLTDPKPVAHYAALYERLSAAALGPAESTDLVKNAAASLAGARAGERLPGSRVRSRRAGLPAPARRGAASARD